MAKKRRPAPLPPPEPHPNLKGLQEHIDAAKRNLQQCQYAWDDEAARLIREQLGEELPQDIELTHGSWDCYESPTAACVYDDAEDPMHDCCVICQQPEERK